MPRTNKRGEKILTMKEQIFVGEMVKNKGNRTESAFKAYNTKSRENARLIGKRVADRPEVRQAIHEAFKRNGMTVDYLIEKEKEIIDKGLKYGKYTVSDARLSIQNMHRLFNSYPERVNKNMNLNINKSLEATDTNEILKILSDVQQTTTELLKDIKKK